MEEEDEVIAGGKIAFDHGAVRIGHAPGFGVELDHVELDRAHRAWLATDLRARDDARQMRKYDADWRPAKARY